jgi:hypothetical protein
MTSGAHDHIHGRCGQLPLVKETLLRGFLVDALVLRVVAALAGCGDDLVPASQSSSVMVGLGMILLLRGGVLEFLQTGSFRGLLLKVLLRYPNVVKESTLFLRIRLHVMLQKGGLGEGGVSNCG